MITKLDIERFDKLKYDRDKDFIEFLSDFVNTLFIVGKHGREYW